MTMFCRGFPFDLVTRVWDIYLFEGYKIVYRVGLALLKLVEGKLLSTNFEGILEILRDINKYSDADRIVKVRVLQCHFAFLDNIISMLLLFP